MTKSTSGGCDQFETSPEAIDQELRTAFCERRQTDILKTNYSVDIVEVELIISILLLELHFNFHSISVYREK